MHEKDQTISKQLLTFIEKHPSCYHVTAGLTEILKEAGFEVLQETRPWHLTPGHSYVVTRNASSLIAFHLPEAPFATVQIAAAPS